jgi:beta-glucuronidase
MNRGTTFLTNVLQRRRRSLDGPWHVIVDPYEMGYVGILGGRNDRGFFRDFRPRHPADRVEYDFDASPTLTVPGDWNTQDERLLYYEGTVWYRRRIVLDRGAAPGQRRFLHVGAANHTSRVFVDGEELATHAGGFGPFAVEVTEQLGPGEHSIVVQVDNRREPDRIPAMRSDWWNFGGLTRSVDLVDVPEVFLRDAWITMAPDGRVVGGMTVDGADGADGASVEVSLPALGVTTTVEGTFELDVDPDRWHPGRPVLHEVVWRVGDDEVRDEVGFRTISTDGTDVLVNDEPTFLRGISIHAEGPSGGRRAHGPADADTLLGWAVDLAANFVRLAHYQHDEHMVRACDRLGLLAWAELPVYWGIAFDRPEVLAQATEQLDELVVRDRSRASVAFWSVANETAPTPERTSFLTALVEHARALDPTRLVTAALLTLPTGELDHLVDDPLGQVVDIVAVNQYLGWYYGERATIADHRWRSVFDKPIVFTELGAGAKAGHHGDPDRIWTEEFQAEIYRGQVEMVRRDLARDDGQVAGMSPWILKDFRAPVRVLPGIQDGYNRKGLVSEEGERKLAFGVLRAFYAELAAGSDAT